MLADIKLEIRNYAFTDYFSGCDVLLKQGDTLLSGLFNSTLKSVVRETNQYELNWEMTKYLW